VLTIALIIDCRSNNGVHGEDRELFDALYVQLTPENNLSNCVNVFSKGLMEKKCL